MSLTEMCIKQPFKVFFNVSFEIFEQSSIKKVGLKFIL